MDKRTIERLLQKGILTHLDIHFARMMEKLDNRDNSLMFLTSAIVSSYTRQGQVCVDIEEMAKKQILPKEEDRDAVFFPDKKTWMNILDQSPIIGKPGDFRPLIMDDNQLLYLHRYFQYQENVIQYIADRCPYTATVNNQMTGEILSRLFPDNEETGRTNWQKIAAIMASLKKFCIISGGPGTGKTTTIVRIIALILEQKQSSSFRIALIAPTGKAAMRLRESIRNAVEKINCPDHIKKNIPLETATIHRFLGTIQGSPYFKHNEKNPLNVDMVIVDESSMVDLALMAKLMQALPSHAALVLLGDKDQLASVEAGAVFGDLCKSGHPSGFSKDFSNKIKLFTPLFTEETSVNKVHTGYVDCVVQLQKSYRFGSKSGIGAVSRAVNSGNGELALKILKDPDSMDIEWVDLVSPNDLFENLEKLVRHELKGYLASCDPNTALKTFEGFRILCALREGPYGAKAINAIIENMLKERNPADISSEWYHLRPVMMNRNNYQLSLFNGDIGITFSDQSDNKRLKVYFSDVNEQLRIFYPDGLSEHEPVYAMTVHKSQGSEFDKTLLILSDQDSPVFTRELLYTGLTRTRNKITVWGREDIFLKAVARNISRASGMVNVLSKL